MKKTKTQKGITLVALIITIIVLLILAVVAINAIKNDRIIEHAKNARESYKTAQKKEQTILDGYLTQIDKNAPVPKATVGRKVSENSTIDGKIYSSTNPVIPAGFKAINTETSHWDAEIGPEVEKGLVISDGTSEFVWIPVANLSEFAKVTSLEDANGRTNYQGVLYGFSGTTATERTNYGQGTENCREPANLSDYDNTTNLSIWTPNLYQESFNKMVESVDKYKGFYVGRYETSLNGNVAQSKAGETPMYNINWFKMYENSLTYSSSNTSLGVQSEMIWGCQWDAMLRFILTGSEASHVTSNSNAPHDFYQWDKENNTYAKDENGKYILTENFVNAPYKTGGTNYSEDYIGEVEYNDKASNIYDLEGNVSELIQEAYTTDRVRRGGNHDSKDYPSNFYRYAPTLYNTYFGSRLSLYIK